jgi:hypothetical protein
VLVDDELAEVVTPSLTGEEIEWIRGAFFATQFICTQVHDLVIRTRQWAPVLVNVLSAVRDAMHNKRHKFMKYVFDGKGAYLKEHTTVYDISGLFEKGEYKDADALFVAVKRATVKKQAIPTDQRYATFMSFTQDFTRLLDLSNEIAVAHRFKVPSKFACYVSVILHRLQTQTQLIEPCNAH